MSSGSQVPREWTYRWTDTTRLIVAFCDFVNVPKNVLVYSVFSSRYYVALGYCVTKQGRTLEM